MLDDRAVALEDDLLQRIQRRVARGSQGSVALDDAVTHEVGCDLASSLSSHTIGHNEDASMTSGCVGVEEAEGVLLVLSNDP